MSEDEYFREGDGIPLGYTIAQGERTMMETLDYEEQETLLCVLRRYIETVESPDGWRAFWIRDGMDAMGTQERHRTELEAIEDLFRSSAFCEDYRSPQWDNPAFREKCLDAINERSYLLDIAEGARRVMEPLNVRRKVKGIRWTSPFGPRAEAAMKLLEKALSELENVRDCSDPGLDPDPD